MSGSAFQAAASVLAADRNLGEDATWTPSGGSAQAVRVVRSRLDGGLGNAAGLTVGMPAAGLTGSPRRGDSLVLAGTTYSIEDADLDAHGAMWTIILSSATYTIPGDPGGSGGGGVPSPELIEAVQDIVGAMVVEAGGTYDDDTGAVTFPPGSGGGGGSGGWSIFLEPARHEPLTNAGATLVTRNDQPVLRFSQISDESAVWSAVLPLGTFGAGMKATIYVAGTDASAGSCTWSVGFDRQPVTGTRNLDNDFFGPTIPIFTAIAANTSGDIVQAEGENGPAADPADWAPGFWPFRIKVTRTVSAGFDTLLVPIDLVGVVLSPGVGDGGGGDG